MDQKKSQSPAPAIVAVSDEERDLLTQKLDDAYSRMQQEFLEVLDQPDEMSDLLKTPARSNREAEDVFMTSPDELQLALSVESKGREAKWPPIPVLDPAFDDRDSKEDLPVASPAASDFADNAIVADSVVERHPDYDRSPVDGPPLLSPDAEIQARGQAERGGPSPGGGDDRPDGEQDDEATQELRARIALERQAQAELELARLEPLGRPGELPRTSSDGIELELSLPQLGRAAFTKLRHHDTRMEDASDAENDDFDTMYANYTESDTDSDSEAGSDSGAAEHHGVETEQASGFDDHERIDGEDSGQDLGTGMSSLSRE